jgi:hypothetical protein
MLAEVWCDASLADGANGLASLAATKNAMRLMLSATSFSASLKVSVVGVHRVRAVVHLTLFF